MPDFTKEPEIQHIRWFGALTLANFLDWMVTLVLAFLIAFMLHQLGGTRPETLAVTTCLTSLLLILHLCWLMVERAGRPFNFHPLLFIFIPFLVYAWINALGLSPAPWSGTLQALAFTQVGIVYWVAGNNLRTRNHIGTMAGVLLGMALLAVLLACNQYFRAPERLPALFNPYEMASYPLSLAAGSATGVTGYFGTPGLLGGFLALTGLIFWVGACSHRFDFTLRLLSGYAGLMCSMAIVLTFDAGVYLAYTLGLLALPLCTAGSARARLFGLLGMIAVLLISAAALYFLLPACAVAIDRLMTGSYWTELIPQWATGWQLFLAHPWWGTGLGGYAVAFESLRPEGFPGTIRYLPNGPLHSLASTGLVGFFLFWLPCGYVAWRAIRAWKSAPRAPLKRGRRAREQVPTPLRRFILTLFVVAGGTFSLHWLVAFHQQVPGLMMVLAVLAAMAVRQMPAPSWEIKNTRAGKAIVLVPLALIAVGLPATMLKPLNGAAHAHEGMRRLQTFAANWQDLRRNPDYLTTTRKHLHRALEARPGDARTQSNLAAATLYLTYTNPADHHAYGEEAEQYARAALDQGLDDAWNWIYLGKALWLQGKTEAVGEAFAAALRQAPQSDAAWYYWAPIRVPALKTARKPCKPSSAAWH